MNPSECCEECLDYDEVGTICCPMTCPCHKETTSDPVKRAEGVEELRQIVRANKELTSEEQQNTIKQAHTDGSWIPSGSEEEWSKEFDEKFSYPHWKETGYNLNKVKDFISTLLAATREEAYEEGLKEWENTNKRYFSREQAYEKGCLDGKVAMQQEVREWAKSPVGATAVDARSRRFIDLDDLTRFLADTETS